MKVFTKDWNGVGPDGVFRFCSPGDAVPVELEAVVPAEFMLDVDSYEPAIAVEDDSAEEFEGAKEMEPSVDKAIHKSPRRKLYSKE